METLKILAVKDPAVMAYVDQKLVDKFPMKVEFDIVPWDKYYNTMMEVLEGKIYYDIIMVAGHLWKRDFVEKGYLAPLSYEKEDILPVIAKEMRVAGKQYLSPSFCDGHMILYRKSVIKEVLLREFDDIITPKEYREAAKKLADAGYLIAMKADESEIFTDALPFLRMEGIDIYDGTTGKIQCDKEEVIKGLETYVSLKQFAWNDTSSYGNEELAKKLQSKEAVMGVTWSGQMGTVMNEACMDKEDIGFATFSTAWNVTWSFAVNNGSTQKELAENFLQFLRSGEIDEKAGEGSGAPVRRGSYLAGMEKYPWYRCQLSMFEHAKLLPDLMRAGEKNGVLYHQIALAFAGEKTPREAMIDAKHEIMKLED
ncbi:MAG: ABC transporter substrate-binding protein [Velocimicrobium sp.]